MEIYLAYSENYAHLLQRAEAKIIISYGRKHGSNQEVYLPPGFDNFLLDSGGYQTAMKTQARDVLIRGYTMWVQFILDKYGEYDKGGLVKGYMGLDTKDWEESLNFYEYMSSEGLTPIPVWKAFWPEEILNYLCDKYPWVAVGGIAFGGSKQDLRDIWERVHLSHPKTKFHMLGVGVRGGFAFKTYRPYSIDVSTWSAPARYGMTIVPDKKQVLRETSLPVELKQKLRDDKAYEAEVVYDAIKILQNLDTLLDDFQEPSQKDMFIGDGK